MVKSILQNLLIGIIGGVYSSLVVSRVFLIRANLQEQIDFLREKIYYLGSLMAFFDVMEILLKAASDTREEMEENIRCNPNYLNKDDIGDMMRKLKTELLDKSVNNICRKTAPVVLKEKEYINLHNEICDSVKKFSDIKKFTFKDVDDGKKVLEGLNEKYEKCKKKRNILFIRLLFKDAMIIILCVIFLLLLALYLYMLLN